MLRVSVYTTTIHLPFGRYLLTITGLMFQMPNLIQMWQRQNNIEIRFGTCEVRSLNKSTLKKRTKVKSKTLILHTNTANSVDSYKTFIHMISNSI